MAKPKPAIVSSDTQRKRRPALSPEARDAQLISYAYDRAEQQILDGTASSQVITHFLKMGSEKEKLELERLREENALLRAKAKAIEESGEIKALYEQALKAMRTYAGLGDPDDYQDVL